MQCDMCGRESHLFVADVEGSRMNVCKACSSYGTVLRSQRPVQAQPKQAIARKPREPEATLIIVHNYPVLLKNAREKLGLMQKELAQKVAEKESTIHHLESGRLEPSLALASKLEKFLRIKLIEELADEESAAPTTKKSGDLTVGDIIKIKTRG